MKKQPFASYSELKEHLYELNRQANIQGVEPKGRAYIVFTEDTFTKKYPLEARTYLFPIYSKAFRCDAFSSSIWATSEDGTDSNVRIDLYMQDKDGWKVESCGLIVEEE